MEDALLQTALERLAEADILLVQGLPPESEYRFKHALIQDAAYENLLKSRRQVLHRRVGEVVLDKFGGTAAAEPELLAHHFTQAGVIEAAIEWWGKAGQRSLERSALVEAAEQLTRALEQIATLPSTAALRREQIRLQVGLITPLFYVTGPAAPETKAAEEQALLLIEQAEALGEPPEDPLLLFSVLYGFWAANYGTFNGDVLCNLAVQFLAVAEKQRATVPLMIGHRLMGTSLMLTGDIAEGRAHLDQAIALYDPAEHRQLTMRFGIDSGVAALAYRSWVLWLLGYPEAARTDADDALKDAREIGQAATLVWGLSHTAILHTLCGNLAAAAEQAYELVALAEEKGSFVYRKAMGMANQVSVLALIGRASEAIEMITAWRATGSTFWMPLYLPHLARAHGELGQFEEAWHGIGEAMTAVETTKEKWCEADVHRTAGELTLMSPEPDAAKAEAYFERALAIARQQQAKSWELRAAMSMARLWRDQASGTTPAICTRSEAGQGVARRAGVMRMPWA